MITVEVNGQRVECADEREAKKTLARLTRQQRKEEKGQEARRAIARLKAEALGWRILSRKASLEGMPKGWRLYFPGHKWAHNLFVPHQEKRDHHRINTEGGYAELHHYGYDLVGAVCMGNGYCWLVFLRDRHRPDVVECYAIAVEGDTHALADCPGVVMTDFLAEPQS